MEPSPIFYDNTMYLLTSKYNKISKSSLIRGKGQNLNHRLGSENIIIEGKAVI